MKKFFTIALMAVVAAFTASVAKADISISGYQEFYAESVDQSTAAGLDASTQTDTSRNGLSNGRFTRLIATASTTLDSGIEVGTVFSIARDGAASGDTDTNTVAVNENSISFSGGFGAISMGNMFSNGTHMHNRGTTLIPTAEPDNGAISNYLTGGGNAEGYGAFDEVGYALDGMKIRYASNVYEGFSFGVSYEPCMGKNTAQVSHYDCNAAGVTSYHDVIDAAVAWSGDFEGVGVSLTYGYVGGNTKIVDATEYNDLENHIYSAKLTVAGATVIYRNNNYGDSGLSKAVENDGDGEGSVWAARYDMGNISLGFAHTETSVVGADGESASTSEIDVFSAGYNLGGGVLIEVAHGTKEEVDGVDNLKDTEADVTLAKLSFGF
jgi:hypothetical protein